MMIAFYLRVLIVFALAQLALIGAAHAVGVLIGGEILLMQTVPRFGHTAFYFVDPYRALSAPTFLQPLSIQYAVMSDYGGVLFVTVEDQVFIADLRTGQIVPVALDLRVYNAEWSPDGTRLLTTFDTVYSHIVMVNRDGSHSIIDSETEQPSDMRPSWSYSGDLILFLRSLTEQMVIADPDTGSVVARREFTPFHTQTSAWIGEYVYYLDNGQNYRWHVRSDATEPLEDAWVFSAPDGMHTLSMIPGEPIFIARIDSEERTLLPFLEGDRIIPRFSPDSTRIVFAGYTASSDLNRITIVDLATGQPLYRFALTGNRLMDDLRWRKDQLVIALDHPDETTYLCVVDLARQRHTCGLWQTPVRAVLLP